MNFNRIFLIVLDSLGVGAMKDAKEYGDVNANTLKSILNAKDNVEIPNLISLGFTNLSDIEKYHNNQPKAIYTKMEEESVGKDTMTGHWEFMGIKTINPFITFTDTGFPDELIKELEEKTGRKVIGNKAASGTEIIDELGPRQMETGELIVYTSADSVLQIAAHEDIIPLKDLYRYCEIAREITMKDEWLLGRVIARPYIGEPNNFKRTSNRHDYALCPPQDTVLDYLKNAGLETISIGKIYDIFNGKGLSESNKTKSNYDGMQQTIEIAKNRDFKGVCFVNLVDFDANFGHRRDPIGYANALEEFDDQLTELLANLKDDDLLMLVADHGNDPCYSGSDHTREYVPLVIYYNKLKEGRRIDDVYSFASVGATIAKNFDVELPKIGSVLDI
ncbi:phosphopentomutase [Bacilli bacterium PM5-3]|nr:phosphopentomutase [Bacilli bacterium PM5-3]MDH6603867.1 phosphopentomutase [Bacilli bacterium PM5-9]